MNDTQLEKMVWLFVWDKFSPDTGEVYEAFKNHGVSRKKILEILQELESMYFVEGRFSDHQGSFSSDRKKFPGKNMIWQSCISNDRYTRDQAITVYDSLRLEIK